MVAGRFFSHVGGKLVVVGHYGSGKTEFAVSLALLLASENAAKTPSPPPPGPCGPRKEGSLALIDLDIVNPYFRSRERRDVLEEAGIAVYGSVYREDITAEIPALGAGVRAPLEDPGCRVIIDAGGNDTGATVLNQFQKYFTGDDTLVLAVVNANRPETGDAAGAARQIAAIESAAGLYVTGIVNNSHLLRETTAGTIIRGHELCLRLCDATGKALLCDCYPEGIVSPEDLAGLSGTLIPMGLLMRPGWLDR